MKLFFDESGYSGCVMPNKNGSLYNDGQRHFVLGGVFVKDENDEHELLQKYCAFKNQFGFEGEVKGSDLMKRENNRALEFFITNILDDKHFYICNYDKIFYLSTLVSVYILGRPFQEKEPLLFYKYVSAISCEKDELFLHYCEAVAHNTEESQKAFLEYICSFPYEKLDRNSNNPYILFATKMLQDLFYDDFPLVYEAYSCKNTVNYVNMTALGELLLCLKHQHGINVSEIEIYHDRLIGYEAEYNQAFADKSIDINFADSKEHELIQLADNICSIYRKCFEKSFEAFRANRQWDENIWFSENYSKIIHKIDMTHIKMVTQIADWALAYTVRDIFGTAKDEYLENKNRFWNLFFFYKERIYREIASIDVTVSL
ncbi:MAG: DUF3800 domain-containing protein [Bacteroidales bacterium]|nr:DUF3800 domain-containing protein [Bacteroidales bacterium]